MRVFQLPVTILARCPVNPLCPAHNSSNLVSGCIASRDIPALSATIMRTFIEISFLVHR